MAVTFFCTVANHLVYDSYGKLEMQTNAAVHCLFGFTGRPFDKFSGLQNNLNRWYDSKVGVWASKDPIGFTSRDGNTVCYCFNSPTNGTDPTGLGFWSDYWYYLWNPSKMDADLRVIDNIAKGAVVGAATAALIVVALPGVIAGSAIGLAGTGLMSLETATTVMSAIATFDLAALLVVGIVTTVQDIQAHNWDAVAFDAGGWIGGILVGCFGGGRTLAGMGPFGPSKVPETWNPLTHASWGWNMKFAPQQGLNPVTWLGTCPDPSGAGAALGGTGATVGSAISGGARSPQGPQKPSQPPK